MPLKPETKNPVGGLREDKGAVITRNVTQEQRLIFKAMRAIGYPLIMLICSANNLCNELGGHAAVAR